MNRVKMEAFVTVLMYVDVLLVGQILLVNQVFIFIIDFLKGITMTIIITWLLLLFFLDVDECSNSTLNNCDHMCANTIGSYNCSCSDGYRLSSNGFTCYGIGIWLL